MKLAFVFIATITYTAWGWAQPIGTTHPIAASAISDSDFDPIANNPGGWADTGIGADVQLLASPGAKLELDALLPLITDMHWSSGGDHPTIFSMKLVNAFVELDAAHLSVELNVFAPPAGPGNNLFDAGVAPEQQGARNRSMLEQPKVYAAKLKALAGKAAGLSAEQVRQKMADLNRRIDDNNAKMNVLTGLSKVQMGWEAQVQQKITQLQGDRLKLELALAPKEARRAALERAIDELKAKASDEQALDAISEQMKKIVAAREAELNSIKQMMRDGRASANEMAAAEAKVAEAKIPLLERQASLGKRGKGELLDRLADELAMVSVDVTEMQFQLDNIRNELKKYDIASAGPEDLKRLAEERAKVPEANTLPPLYTELQKKQRELMKEKFGLEVADVKLVQQSPPGPMPAPGGSPGIGGPSPSAGGAGIGPGPNPAIESPSNVP